MVRVDKETLFYPLNTNTEKVKVLFIFLKPPSMQVKFQLKDLCQHIFRVTFLKYCLATEFLGDFDREGLGRSHAGAMNQTEFRETCSCNILSDCIAFSRKAALAAY